MTDRDLVKRIEQWAMSIERTERLLKVVGNIFDGNEVSGWAGNYDSVLWSAQDLVTNVHTDMNEVVKSICNIKQSA